MLPLRWKRTWLPRARRITAGVVLFSYVVAALGIPIPRVVAKDRSQSFPCQGHLCGCRSAESCWRQCCCMTPRAKEAWARERNITPPAYAEKPGDLGWKSPRLRDKHDAAPSSRACCEKEGPSKNACCKAHDNARPAADKKTAAPRKPPTGTPWRLGLSPLRCECSGTYWVTAGSVLPTFPAPAWVPHLVPLDWLSDSTAMAPCLSLIPPDPPPRLSA